MSLKVWIESTKPKVFTASIAPVLVGSALAQADGVLTPWKAPFILICAMLIQTISNWVNDIYDFRRGADERGRVGPRRVLVEGFLTPEQLIRASWIAGGVCFLLGLPLVLSSGWPTLAMGLACLAAAWAYTGGRFNLAYHGLGDLAAFLFFGVVGVAGTYFVYAAHFSGEALLVSIGPGFMVANILNVNNIRDIPTDTLVGKRTLAVRLGGTAARWLYVLLCLTAIICPALLLSTRRGSWLMAPIAALPYGLLVCVMVLRRQGADLNPALFGSAILYMQYALLLAFGLVMSSL